MSQLLSSAAVVIGALRVNHFLPYIVWMIDYIVVISKLYYFCFCRLFSFFANCEDPDGMSPSVAFHQGLYNLQK